MPNDGKAFEKRIYDLLSLSSVLNLTREQQLGSIKPDITFEETDWGKRVRYGVECKDHASALTKDEVSKILGRYRGALRTKKIDRLLIVSNHPLAAGAQTFVEENDEVAYQTEGDLRNSIIDFRNYLTGLKAKFLKSPVMNYYVEPQGQIFGPNGELEGETPNLLHRYMTTNIVNQLDNLSGPLVVLGSYGIGKTTLAQKVFLTLLERWEKDSSEPIPIFISLDQMQREQSIQGLLGAIFTASSTTRGYNFDLFEAMNREGHFIIIMDGVDEMRHSVSRFEFERNIDELSKLTKDNPRSLILGRPTIYMDETEFAYATRGHRSGRHQFRTPTGYRVWEIQLMSDAQIRDFVIRYCAWAYSDGSITPKDIFDFIWSNKNEAIGDIAKRPVQLMMILQIFPELRGQNASLSLIYELFIDDLLSREDEKRRVGPSIEKQREFSRLIAVWLWRQGMRGRIEASRIPLELFDNLIEDDGDREVARRHFMAASFLSTERGSNLHFPHRSIQEFCIAEYIWVKLGNPEPLLDQEPKLKEEIDLMFTDEVTDFLVSRIDDDVDDRRAQKVRRLIEFLDRLSTIPTSMGALMSAGPKIATTVLRQFEWAGSIASGWLWLLNEFGDSTDSYRRAEQLGTLDATIISQVKTTADEYHRAGHHGRVEIEPVFNLLLMQFILLHHESANKARVLKGIADSLAHLARIGRTKWIDVEGEYGQTVHREKFFPNADAHELLWRLSRSNESQTIDIRWVYKWLRQKSATLPIPKLWAHGETIHLPDVRLFTSLNSKMAGFSEIRDVLGDFRRRFPVELKPSDFAPRP